jgi:hypothetical protein
MTTHDDGHHHAERPEDEIETYAGHIEARHGRIPLWLIGVYFTLFVWSLWYAYYEWGSLGPGLSYATP